MTWLLAPGATTMLFSPLAATVIRDRFVTAAQLCAGPLRTACRRAGIAS